MQVKITWYMDDIICLKVIFVAHCKSVALCFQALTGTKNSLTGKEAEEDAGKGSVSVGERSRPKKG